MVGTKHTDINLSVADRQSFDADRIRLSIFMFIRIEDRDRGSGSYLELGQVNNCQMVSVHIKTSAWLLKHLKLF